MLQIMKEEAYAEKNKLIKAGKEKDAKIEELMKRLDLKEIQKDSPHYNLAASLKKYVKYFKDIEDDMVPANSLLREFIGGSCFKV